LTGIKAGPVGRANNAAFAMEGPMPQIDVLVIVAAALSTLVIWLGVVVQGRIAAALASRH